MVCTVLGSQLRRAPQHSTAQARAAWLGELAAGKVDVEELKLALGLRAQHAARAGLDGDGGAVPSVAPVVLRLFLWVSPVRR